VGQAEQFMAHQAAKKLANPNLHELQLNLGTQVQMHSGSNRRLNPRFVEWLMGFPIGWTDR